VSAQAGPDFAELLAALVHALPRCDVHVGNPATRAFARGVDRFCDRCADQLSAAGLPVPPEYPRAPALRAALRALQERGP